MIPIQEASTVALYGGTSSGKTHLMKTLVAPYRRVLWNDTTFEMETDNSFEHIYSPSLLVNRFRNHNDERSYRVCYHPTYRDIELEFDLVSRMYWQEDDPRWFVVDEVHEFNQCENIIPMLKYSRKRKLGIIIASQRICDVKPAIRTNCRTTILFFAHEMRDLAAIRESYGIEVMEEVKKLRPLIYHDVKKVVEQYPQVVVYRRGQPIEIHDLSPERNATETNEIQADPTGTETGNSDGGQEQD